MRKKYLEKVIKPVTFVSETLRGFIFSLHSSLIIKPSLPISSEAYLGPCWISGEAFLRKDQPAFTYSKLTIETPEQDVKYVQS